MLRAISLIALLAGCTTGEQALQNALASCNGDYQCQQVTLQQYQVNAMLAQQRAMAWGNLSTNLASMSNSMRAAETAQAGYYTPPNAWMYNPTGAGIGACYGGSVGTCY